MTIKTEVQKHHAWAWILLLLLFPSEFLHANQCPDTMIKITAREANKSVFFDIQNVTQRPINVQIGFNTAVNLNTAFSDPESHRGQPFFRRNVLGQQKQTIELSSIDPQKPFAYKYYYFCDYAFVQEEDLGPPSPTGNLCPEKDAAWIGIIHGQHIIPLAASHGDSGIGFSEIPLGCKALPNIIPLTWQSADSRAPVGQISIIGSEKDKDSSGNVFAIAFTVDPTQRSRLTESTFFVTTNATVIPYKDSEGTIVGAFVYHGKKFILTAEDLEGSENNGIRLYRVDTSSKTEVFDTEAH